VCGVGGGGVRGLGCLVGSVGQPAWPVAQQHVGCPWSSVGRVGCVGKAMCGGGVVWEGGYIPAQYDKEVMLRVYQPNVKRNVTRL